MIAQPPSPTVSFNETVRVRKIPMAKECEKEKLFYTADDISLFREEAKEQIRQYRLRKQRAALAKEQKQNEAKRVSEEKEAQSRKRRRTEKPTEIAHGHQRETTATATPASIVLPVSPEIATSTTSFATPVVTPPRVSSPPPSAPGPRVDSPNPAQSTTATEAMQMQQMQLQSPQLTTESTLLLLEQAKMELMALMLLQQQQGLLYKSL